MRTESSSAARKNFLPSYIDREEKTTIQISGNNKYNGYGTGTGESIFFKNDNVLREGRMVAENQRQNMTVMPSRIIENNAKFTENRLSMVQSTLY
jgi:hypothetical protein